MTSKQVQPQNRDGFYIERDDCVTMGCCHDDATEMIIWHPEYGSMVIKQPDSADELGAIITAASNCVVQAIRYGGVDQTIAKRVEKAIDG